MLQRILTTFIAPALIISIGLLAFFWLRAHSEPPPRERQPPIPPLVQTIVLQSTETRFDIRVGGNVVPHREVTISAEVSGAIVSKATEAKGGRHVRQGVPLLQIDPAKYLLAVKEFDGEKNQILEDLRRVDVEESGTVALIEIAEQESQLATQELARLRSLKSKNAATDTDVDRAASAELKARNALRVLHNIRELIPVRRERLQVQLKLVGLRRQQAQRDLDRTQITAPFDGIITSAAVEQGNFVQSGDVLLKIEETASVEVDCSLRTDDLYWLWNSSASPPAAENNEDADRVFFEVPAADATVTYDVAGREFAWQGRLSRYEGGGIDRKTRTVTCRVVVVKPKRGDAGDGPPALMRGMYVTVSLGVTPRIRLWKIPNRAVRPNGQIWTVEDGQIRIHEVQAARVLPDAVLVRVESTDLKAGDRMVVSQLATAFDGMQVREAGESGSSTP